MMVTSLVGVVSDSRSTSDGSMVGVAFAARSAVAAIAHLVDRNPLGA